MRFYLGLLLFSSLNFAFALDFQNGEIHIKAKEKIISIAWSCDIAPSEGVVVGMYFSSKNSKKSEGKKSEFVSLVNVNEAVSCTDVLFDTEDIDEDGVPDIAIWASDGGIRKSMEILLLDSEKEIFHHAGSLPIAGEKTGPRKYELIESQGGSVYETVIEVKEKKLETTAQKELMLDGKICRSKEGALLSSISDCSGETLIATKRHPLCIVHQPGSARVVAKDMCRKLLTIPIFSR